MPLIGSFALLLALAFAAYSFIGGALGFTARTTAWARPLGAPASPRGQR
jgi:hypothetical protein